MSEMSVSGRMIIKPSIAYTFDMTLVLALIAEDGIVAMSDGRVFTNGKALKPEKEDQLKIFQLSPLCVALFAGGVAKGIEDIIEEYEAMFRNTGKVHVTDIALLMRNLGQVGRLRGSEFIFAGYDMNMSGHHPKAIYMSGSDYYDDKSYVMAGKTEYAKKYLDDHLPERSKKMADLNELAMEAMCLTISKDNDIGGVISLRNLPFGEAIREFSVDEVETLKHRARTKLGMTDQ